ncbi:MAG: ABC transporter permease subunit [Armatimonadia bacterium]|nr:ABC transporter permease subunit [Armatimonadia bacterium]
MRAALVIAGSTIKCGLRSKGIWVVVIASVVPMLLLYAVLHLLPDNIFGAAIELAAGLHGEDPKESSEMILGGSAEDRRVFITDTTVSGSMKLIGVVGTAIAILFTVMTNEAGRKSLPHILAHPIPRVSIVAGSYLGTLAVTWGAVAIMATFGFLLYLATQGTANWGLFVGAGFMGIGMSVTAAYCVLLTTVLPSVISILAAFLFAWVASQTYHVRVALKNVTLGMVDTLGDAWMWVIPRLGDFGVRGVDWAIRINVGDDNFQWADTGNMLTATIMAAVHIALALTIAGVHLNRKAV